MVRSVRAFFFFLFAVLAIATLAHASEKTSTSPPVIVVGFMGGRVRHDNVVHSGVQMAARQQRNSPSTCWLWLRLRSCFW